MLIMCGTFLGKFCCYGNWGIFTIKLYTDLSFLFTCSFLNIFCPWSSVWPTVIWFLAVISSLLSLLFLCLFTWFQWPVIGCNNVSTCKMNCKPLKIVSFFKVFFFSLTTCFHLYVHHQELKLLCAGNCCVSVILVKVPFLHAVPSTCKCIP